MKKGRRETVSPPPVPDPEPSRLDVLKTIDVEVEGVRRCSAVVLAALFLQCCQGNCKAIEFWFSQVDPVYLRTVEPAAALETAATMPANMAANSPPEFAATVPFRMRRA